MKIAFIGMMLSGKSTVAGALAERLAGYRFLETDAIVERIEGLSISHIFEKKGERAFRELEARVFRELSAQDRIVVACGGGLPMSADNRAVLATYDYVFFLRASLSVLRARLTPEECEKRPLLSVDPEVTLTWLLPARTPVYEEACTHIIDADAPVSEIVTAVVSILSGGS